MATRQSTCPNNLHKSRKWTELPLPKQLDHQRTELMAVHGVLVCLTDVLLYSDDDNAAMHADVSRFCGRLVNDVVVDLEIIRNQLPMASEDAANNNLGEVGHDN